MMANQEESDRLSALPDHILHRILSLLDTKSAIRTSALSKHYRHAWTSVSSLYFKITCTQHDYFEDYIIAVLKQREPLNLRSFLLLEHCHMSSEFTSKCIDYAAQHKVQYLRLRVYAYPTLRLPQHLLTSTFLVTLRLRNATAISIHLPISVSLPNLKGLHLKNFAFSDNNYDGQFFSGCPSLENLVLIKCWIRSRARLSILNLNCPNLTGLEIRTWRTPWECFHTHVIHIFAPRLLFFKLEGQLVQVYFKGSPPSSLKEAYIDLSHPTPCSTERMETAYGSLTVLLFQINRVGFLSLRSRTDEVLSFNHESSKLILSLFASWEIVKERQEKAIKALKRLFWPYPI